MPEKINVAVVGATGAVGRQMLEVLEKRQFPVDRLSLYASHRSAGQKLEFGDRVVEVEALPHGNFEKTDVALFSAGSSVSEQFAPKAVEQGAVVIDNTSAFRMDERVPLVVPEVNAGKVDEHDGIIANPNCSTIQMVVALKPLYDEFGIDRIVVNTYQSASGAGQSGVEELISGSRAYLEGTAEPEPDTFSAPIAFNALPHIGPFFESGFTQEETKMVNETQKIFEDDAIDVAATCVRIPAIRAHSEAITVDLKRPAKTDEVGQLFETGAGIAVLDNPENFTYPTARRAANTDEVWVGRIRRDLDRPETLHFWCVSDNLLKGAALNSVQIAERLIGNDF